MKKDEYLKSAFDKFNKGEISAEAYDAILMNLDEFVEDEITQGPDEYETGSRYFVYDLNNNVISDGFSYIEDAREFANSRKDAGVIKEHNYYRDERGKLQPDGDPEVAEIKIELFAEKVYEKYKQDWCGQQGVNPEDVDEEIGVNGECYVCFKEFLDHEFQDWEYMKALLSADEFERWEACSPKENTGVIERPQPFKKYRVVLTCFDPGEEPYGDCNEKFWDEQQDAYELAKNMATAECADLNGENSGIVPEVGCFEVDDCANNDFEVRWYEKKPEERDEGSCDIEYVTTYNVYPIEFTGSDLSSCKYRGFDIKQTDAGLKIYHNGTCLGGTVNILNAALNRVDDICLECAKDKTCALEAVHKVPLEVIIKFASQKQENKLYGDKEIKRDIGER